MFTYLNQLTYTNLLTYLPIENRRNIIMCQKPIDHIVSYHKKKSLSSLHINLTTLPIHICVKKYLRCTSKFSAFSLSCPQRVSLQDNGLVEVPSAALTHLSYVTWLDLRYNFLQCLPNEVASLTHLQVLLLQDNHLTALPPALGKSILLFDVCMILDLGAGIFGNKSGV